MKRLDPSLQLALALALVILGRPLLERDGMDSIGRETTDRINPPCGLADLARFGQIELNCATEEALAALPGVGPALAAKIVAWRGQQGSYKRVEDLLAVPGFGKKRVKQITPYLY